MMLGRRQRTIRVAHLITLCQHQRAIKLRMHCSAAEKLALSSISRSNSSWICSQPASVYARGAVDALSASFTGIRVTWATTAPDSERNGTLVFERCCGAYEWRYQPPRRFSSNISTGIEWSSRQTIWMGRSDLKLTSFAGPRNVKGDVVPTTFLRERTKNSIV